MAKSTVSSIITKVKRRVDYDITDTDLDNLLVDIINDCLKIIHQWFIDYGLFINNAASTTLTCTASQAYIDISTTLATMDEVIRLSERTNDKPIVMIPYEEFVRLYPDPTANTSVMPNHAAIWNERLYLGPTPTTTSTLYIEYTTIPTEVTSSSSLFFKTKFDPILIAMACEKWTRWYDKNNRQTIKTYEEETTKMKYELIVNAAHNIGENRQSQSRNEDDGFYPNPQAPE